MKQRQDAGTTSRAMEMMIRQQLVERGIDNPAVIQAFSRIPREIFFPRDDQESAYDDRAASIGYGQTISQPYMVALMTQRLTIDKTHRVLEIGTGSGYQTALLSNLAKDVFTVERVKPLLDLAWNRLMDLSCRNVHFKHADGTLGWAEFAPFDRILITAGAPHLPEALLHSQLADGGVAILPAGPHEQQVLLEVRRRGDLLETSEICACRFVKLIGSAGWTDEK